MLDVYTCVELEWRLEHKSSLAMEGSQLAANALLRKAWTIKHEP